LHQPETADSTGQGCQMVHFHTKNPHLGGPWNGKYWFTKYQILVFYDNLEYFTAIWYCSLLQLCICV
jgi:hypothetical protein